jgi:hypothetical protein
MSGALSRPCSSCSLEQEDIVNPDDEYQSLRQEILGHMKRNADIEVGYVTLAIAIMGYPLTLRTIASLEVGSFYYYLPAIICVLATAYMAQTDRTIRDIGTFLLVFHEEEASRGHWERALRQLRTNAAAGSGISHGGRGVHRAELRALVPIGIILAAPFLRWRVFGTPQWYDLIYSGFALVAEFILVWKWQSVFSSSNVSSSVDQWRRVYEVLHGRKNDE